MQRKVKTKFAALNTDLKLNRQTDKQTNGLNTDLK